MSSRVTDAQARAAAGVIAQTLDGYYGPVLLDVAREALEAAAAVPPGARVITIVRNEAGAVDITLVREDGRTGGIATYTDAADYMPTLGDMIDRML